jgi:hypothetical protein
MHTSIATRLNSPFGQAFPLEELVYARHWARRRGLRLTIRLDQVLDGVAFDELLLVHAPGPSRHAASLWRTRNAIIVQENGGQPIAFAALRPALVYVAVRLAPAPSRWRLVSRLLFG